MNKNSDHSGDTNKTNKFQKVGSRFLSRLVQ